MRYEITILFPGFSGKMNQCALGWSTFALIRGEGRHILLDTGGVGLRQAYGDILGAEGLTPSDIDCVLLTHLHFDHAANVDLLPGATFAFAQSEWDYALQPENRDLFIQESALMPLRYAKKIVVREDGQSILPGITAIATPGHTPGSTSYLIDQGNGEKWLLVGDAAKTRGELRTGTAQMSVDPEKSRASLARICKLANRVLPGHDGWLRIEGETILPEGSNDLTLFFSQGVTVNGGLSELHLRMDD